LKWVLVMKGWLRYFGSSTMVKTVSQVFGGLRVVAVRHAILAQISGRQTGRHNFLRADSRRRLLNADAETSRLST
jgi:hypothetical protein